MKNTNDLVTKIINNTAQRIEINEQIACSSEKPLPGVTWGQMQTVIPIGNNQVLIIAHYDRKACIFDLSTKAILSTPVLQLASFSTAVLLDDTNYLAIADREGKLLILNLRNMQITATHEIAKSDQYGRHMITQLCINNGQLYGMTDSSYSPGRLFFSAPAVPSLTPKIVKIDNVTSNNFAVDASGHVYFGYGRYADMSSSKIRDNPSLYDLGSSLHLGTEMRLIQQKTGNSFLVIKNSNLDNDPGICIFKGEPGVDRIFPSYLHGSKTFIKERLWNMEILSEKDRLLIVTTDKATYIYDLQQQKVIGQFKTMQSFHVVSDGSLFIYNPTEKRNEDVSILTAHNLQEPNALSQVFEALKNNLSVSQVTMDSAKLDAGSLQSLYQLKIKRPELKLELSPIIVSALSLIEKQETEKAEKEAISTRLTTTIRSHDQTLATKTLELNLKMEECGSLREQLNVLGNEEKEMQLAHERQLSESNVIFSAQSAELQQKIHLQEGLISEFKDHLTNNQATIDSLQEELSNISQAYSEVVTLLSQKPILSKPLIEQLREIKEAISPELFTELLNEETDLCNISLIRWSEQTEIQRYQNTLRQKKAILNVTDLLTQINKIKPPFNEKETMDRLLVAVETLELNYENKLLPPSVIKTLVDLIVPDIENILKSGEPKWLRRLHLLTINEIKLQLKIAFFSPHYSEAIPSVMAQYNQAINELSQNEEYDDLYHEFLKDPQLLHKIREGYSKEGFEQLIELIKVKIHINTIELTAAQKNQALHSLLKKPELIDLIYKLIINYWEKTKERFNPEMVNLKDENLTLKKQLESATAVNLSELNVATMHPAFFFPRRSSEPCLMHLSNSLKN